MAAKPEVKVGQVWRERDSRFTRHVRIDSPAFKDRQPAMWIVPCSETGNGRAHGRVSRIKVSNIQTRFELVRDVQRGESALRRPHSDVEPERFVQPLT